MMKDRMEQPLTLAQLMQIRPEQPILVRVRCIDEESRQPCDDEDFEIWDGRCFANADTYDTLEHYGTKFLAYAYRPPELPGDSAAEE